MTRYIRLWYNGPNGPFDSSITMINALLFTQERACAFYWLPLRECQIRNRRLRGHFESLSCCAIY